MGDGECSSETPTPPVDGVFEPFTQRYFTEWRVKNAEKLGVEHQYVYEHSNRLFVVGVSKEHPLFAGDAKVSSVKWHGSVSDVKVSGKRKKGAMGVGERNF